jgi:ATP-dependent 26S proteasome regulatory subunit
MPVKKRAPHVVTMLLDSSVPLAERALFLHSMAAHDPKQSHEVFEQLLTVAASANGEDACKKKIAELDGILAEMKAGPLRCATFVGQSNGSLARAHVLLQDGTAAWVPVPDRQLADSLCCGDTVLIEANGKALLDKGPALTAIGEEARFERRIDDQRVEVILREHDSHVFRITDALRAKLDRDEVPCGSNVLVCSRRQMAFDNVPHPDGKSYYRFLSRAPVPDILIDRDIGSPPKLLAEIERHVRREVTDFRLGRRYRINRSITRLLKGPSGTGKTLCLEGSIRLIYQIMSEVCNVPIGALPQRVLRLRVSKLLSKWLGESDKNIDRFFDEVEQLADERFVAPDGTEYELPVIVCFEEADALARRRGEDSIYDRIQAALFPRLDATYRTLKDKLIVFLFTTNLPELLDPAFMRRAGGTVEHFGRLDKRAFLTVLDKQLRDRPFAARLRIMHEVAGWLFSHNCDKGQVELRFVHSSTPVVKYRRDFLTGGLVDRAVQQASAEACEAERAGHDRPGITSEMLITALHQQVRSLVDSLNEQNVSHYATLPEGARVSNVRPIEQPTILPIELERAS